MAKMKVHELAKELEIQSKDIITYLKEKGMEVKAATSSIEDEAIALVRGRFRPHAEKPAKEAAVATLEVKKEVKEDPAVEKEASPEKMKAEKPAVERKPAGEGGKMQEPPKKKKKIIIINNSVKIKMAGNRGGYRNNGGRK